jgi:hypothetical protein
MATVKWEGWKKDVVQVILLTRTSVFQSHTYFQLSLIQVFTAFSMLLYAFEER